MGALLSRRKKKRRFIDFSVSSGLAAFLIYVHHLRTKKMSLRSSIILAAAVLLLAVTLSHAAPIKDRRILAEKVRAHRAASGLSTPATVPFLNVTQYLGFWNQVYTDSFNSIFEPNPYCSSALYGVNPNGTISVRNRDTSGNWTTGARVVDGWAFQDDAAAFPGRLSVHLECSNCWGFAAPYWVYALGPVVNDQYEFAIISDMDSLSLFVNTRDVARFDALYDAQVKNFLTAAGFTIPDINQPIRIPQGPLCPFR